MASQFAPGAKPSERKPIVPNTTTREHVVSDVEIEISEGLLFLTFLRSATPRVTLIVSPERAHDIGMKIRERLAEFEPWN